MIEISSLWVHLANIPIIHIIQGIREGYTTAGVYPISYTRCFGRPAEYCHHTVIIRGNSSILAVLILIALN